MVEPVRHCPALLIGASASGQGKTTITAALARLHRLLGRRVRVFKAGADFEDPMLLSVAAGTPCRQLDLFLGGEAHCRQLLHQAAGEADLILLEGVMGLFDGSPSSADLAELFGMPVAVVVDAAAMAQTFAALAHGLASYRPQLPFAGVVANGVAGEYHRGLLSAGLTPATPLLASLPRGADLALPASAAELADPAAWLDLKRRLDALARVLADQPIAELPPPVAFPAVTAASASASLLAGVRIAVARDAAFAQLYAANLELLQRMGAELRLFSPLRDHRLPDCDSLYLPGGWIARHAAALAANSGLLAAIRAHHQAGQPLLAEGEGMLLLLESVTDRAGNRHRLAEVLPGQATVGEQVRAVGPQQLALPEGELRGNSYHCLTVRSATPVVALGRCPNGGPIREPVYRLGRLTASCSQFYFPSNPTAIARLLLP